MKLFIKNLICASLAVVVLALAGTASATCVSGCEAVVTTTTTPNPEPTTSTFTVGGWSSFGGNAAAGFNGSTGVTGFAMVEKLGYGGTDTALNLGGNLCGTTCQSGTMTFTGYAGEHVKASAGALVTTPGGGTVGVANFGNANSGVGFNFQKALTGTR